MKITDGKLTLKITMKEKSLGKWLRGNYAFDFFECGGLKQDDDGSYIVPDVNYCICQVLDWMARKGDFRYDCDENERTVDIIVIE